MWLNAGKLLSIVYRPTAKRHLFLWSRGDNGRLLVYIPEYFWFICRKRGGVDKIPSRLEVKPGEREKEMRRMKRKTVWAYLDGKKLVDVVKAALDNNMMVDDLKKKLIEENPGHEVTFKI